MKTYREIFKKITQEVKEYQREKDYKKFKKLDTHEHVGDDADFEAFLEVMAEFNIEKTFLMPTGKNHERQRAALKAQAQYPDKFVAFGFLDTLGKEGENYLSSLIEQGIKGVKFLFWHPAVYPEKKIAFDSPEALNVFEICAKRRLPVVAHLSLHNFPEQKEQLEHTLKKFPEHVFVIPHYLETAPELAVASELLDAHANLYTDISMGGGKNRYVAYIQGFRKRFRSFFKKYQDRLFWGTDIFIEAKSVHEMNFYRERIRHDINMLDERFFYSPFFKESQFLQGLNFSDEILEKVFYKNAERVLSMP